MLGRLSRKKEETSNRKLPYASKKTDEEKMGDLSEKLVNDLKKEILSIQNHEVLSEQWFETARVIGRLATVVRTEDSFEKESKDATLWEGEEAALRNLLENGKIPILLRMLEDFKKFQRNAIDREDNRLLEDDFHMMSCGYETSLCLILCYSLSHLEVVQTLNCNLLCEIIHDSITFVLCHPEAMPENDTGCLESASFELLKLLVKQSEQIGEDRVMETVLKNHIFVLFLRHLRTNMEKLRDNSLLLGLSALSSIIDTEMFDIQNNEFIPDECDRKGLLEVEEVVVGFSESSAENRRELRPLLDEIRRIKRATQKK